MELTSKYKFRDNIYMVPMLGEYLGDATISSERGRSGCGDHAQQRHLESETFSPVLARTPGVPSAEHLTSGACGRRRSTR